MTTKRGPVAQKKLTGLQVFELVVVIAVAVAITIGGVKYIDHKYSKPAATTVYTVSCESKGQQFEMKTQYLPHLQYGTFQMTDGRVYIIPPDSICDYSPKAPE